MKYQNIIKITCIVKLKTKIISIFEIASMAKCKKYTVKNLLISYTVILSNIVNYQSNCLR